MGMNWESTVVIGFVIDKDDLEMPFKQTVPEQFHMENRFDPRTGKKLAKPVKVVDEPESEVFFFEGKNIGEDTSDLVEILENEVECVINVHGNYATGHDLVYSIQPRFKSIDDGLTLQQVGELQNECARIRTAFKGRYGIDIGEPKVKSVMSYL